MIMLASGRGFEREVMNEIDGLATNSCFIWGGRTSEPYKGFKKGRVWNIHNRDVVAARENIPEIEVITPVLSAWAWGNSGGNVVRNDRAGTYTVVGHYPDYTKVEAQRLKYGRFINDLDILNNRKVCVIGTSVYEELFKKDENPLGSYIRINGIYYQVVGVASGVSGIGVFGPPAELVILPFTTLQQVNNWGDIVHDVAAVAKKGVEASYIEERIKEIFRAQNSISPTDLQAVGSFNLAKHFNMFNALFLGIRILIWIVGLGTLLAGMVGISNIMLVTVKERTREIGVRRALGAKPGAILSQVLFESLLLSFIAGMLGLCLGAGITGMLNAATADSGNAFLSNAIIPFNAAVASTVVLLLSGLLAGAIPAWRALQIKAIDAIREE
jgi:putative ABC transport system permease protein